MIHLQDQPLTDQQKQHPSAWLNSATARLFLDWVASQGARKQAEAGKLLVSNEECDSIESKKAAEEGRRYAYTLSVFEEAKDTDHLFLTKLQPNPAPGK